MDDCTIKGPPTCYEDEEGKFQTLADSLGIWLFLWQHFGDLHCILHCLRVAGATVSAKKLCVAVPEVVILGHKCNYEGRVPDDSKIAKIRDWPSCKNLANVRAFLGIAGYMRIWICNYSSISRPLITLTRKDTSFIWQDEQE